MLPVFLKYLRIVLFVLIGLSYLMVLLCLTLIDSLYYGSFIFTGSVFIILYFLIEGFQYFYLKGKQQNKKKQWSENPDKRSS